jgi:biotin synthase-like enzyme
LVPDRNHLRQNCEYCSRSMHKQPEREAEG